MKSRGRDLFAKFKALLGVGAKFYGLFPRKMRMGIWNRISNKRGVLRVAQRYMLLKSLAYSVGDNVAVYDHVYLFHPENIAFGDNISIHPMCYIQGAGGIEIGDNVSIAHAVTIMTENHGYDDPMVPIKEQPIKTLPITIESDVWIGAKATVLSGVKINKRTVVAAGAVVTKSFPAGVILAGIPAVIKKEI